MHHLEVKLDPRGMGTILLDGIPISKYTNGISISSQVLTGTHVNLSLVPGGELDFAQGWAWGCGMGDMESVRAVRGAALDPLKDARSEAWGRRWGQGLWGALVFRRREVERGKWLDGAALEGHATGH